MSLAKRWLPPGPYFRGKMFPTADRSTRASMVVPLRDLNAADRLLPFFSALVQTTEISLRLIHVRSPAAWADTHDVLLVDDGQEIGFRLRSSLELDALAKRWSPRLGSEIVTEARISSSSLSAVESAMRTGDAYVVVRQPERNRWNRIWSNGGEDDIIRSSFPVFIVPDSDEAWRAQRRQIRRVLLALDDRPESLEIVSRALSLLDKRAEYIALRVASLSTLGSLRPGPTASGLQQRDDFLAQRNRAWLAMQQASRQIEAAEARVETALVYDSLDVGDAILSQAAVRQADLIVIARQQPGLRFWKSLAWEQVARKSRIPVLLCPPPGQ